MLTRVSLFVAIVLGLGVAVLNIVVLKDKVTTLVTDRNDQRTAKDTAQKSLGERTKELAKTSAELTATKENLASTTKERDEAVANANDLTKKNSKLTSDLNRTTEERNATRDELAAYKFVGWTPDQITKFRKQYDEMVIAVAAIEQENKFFLRKVEALDTELKYYRDPEQKVLLPATLSGKVLVSDPKWNFVVLDVGEEQGVKPYGQLLINRNGKLVAKVQVSSIQKGRCIANVLPGWQIGEVMEGDLVIPAYPAS